jgi:lipopolysaccharide export system permease protein
MRILDKYILNRVAAGYLFMLLVFIGLYFIIDTFVNLPDILKNKPAPLVLAQYYMYSLPLIILRVSPFSLLISVLYGFAELNKNNEIMSIRTSGFSLLRLALPVVLFTFLISATTFAIQEKVLIYSQQKVEEIKSDSLKKKSTKTSEEKNLAFSSGKMIFFVGKFSVQLKTLYNVKIFKQDKSGNIVTQMMCTQIRYEGGSWIARDIIEYELDENGKIKGTPTQKDTETIDLAEGPDELLLKKSILLEFSSLEDLREEIRNLQKVETSEKLSRLIASYHQKIAEPFSHIFLVVGILPLALDIKKRKAALSSVGIGFIFFFVYLVLSSFSLALGKSGVLLPVLSAWVAPLFLLAVGLTGLALSR